jgi:ABC-type transport system involved in multi-copper enzyme maturation permease subunit
VIHQLRAEVLKIRTTRTSLALALGMVLLVLLFALLGGLLTPDGDLLGEANQHSLLSVGQVATVFAALVGIMLVTAEFRHGTIRPTLLYEPRRPVLVGAKLGAGLAMGVAFGVVAIGLAVGIARIVLASRDIQWEVSGTTLVHVTVGSVASAAVWALWGVAIGAIVRNQVGAIVGLLAYAFVVESIVFGLVPSVGRFLPGPVTQAMQGDTNDQLLGWPAGAGLAVGYLVVLAAAAVVLTAVRDVD